MIMTILSWTISLISTDSHAVSSWLKSFPMIFILAQLWKCTHFNNAKLKIVHNLYTQHKRLIKICTCHVHYSILNWFNTKVSNYLLNWKQITSVMFFIDPNQQSIYSTHSVIHSFVHSCIHSFIKHSHKSQQFTFTFTTTSTLLLVRW